MAGLVLTYCVHMGALILYFDLSISYAQSSTEIDGIVGGDGAKLIFNGLFFAPVASLALAASGFAVRICRRLPGGFNCCSEPTEFDVAIKPRSG